MEYGCEYTHAKTSSYQLGLNACALMVEFVTRNPKIGLLANAVMMIA